MMKNIRSDLSVCFLVPILNTGLQAQDKELYFPPHQGTWQRVKPADVGWDQARLQKALDHAGQQRSSGVVILLQGRILAGKYLKAATTTSQELNPYYGYLWWVNGNAKAPEHAPRIATAPKDMFSANGALNRRCFVVPSLQLVVTRLGDQPTVKRNGFDRQLWKLIMAAAPVH